MSINLPESLAKTSRSLMIKEPFYGLFLIMLNKIWDKRVPTAGVGLNGINYHLIINEDFWIPLTDNQRIGLLKHEVLHVGFFHLTDFHHQTNKEISNWAQDIEINQYIAPEFLPPGPLLPSSFPELNLEPKKGCQYYYDKLMQASLNAPQCPNMVILLGAGANGESMTTDVDGNPMQVPHHDRSVFENLGQATQKLIQKQTEFILKALAEQCSKSTGSIPGEFKEILDRINYKEPPKFDWKGYMRRFIGRSTRVYTKKSHSKFNKRFEGMPGLKLKKRKHVLVAVDTSGSVSRDELKEFFHEIYHMYKGGTEVTVLQCDVAISSITPYKRGSENNIKVTGRGGTSFVPIVDYANEHGNKFTALIVFTDGEASAPEKCKIKTLWVHSSRSNINTDLIGDKIKLN